MDFLKSKSLLAAFICLAAFSNALGESVTTQGAVNLWTRSDGALTCAVTGNPTQVTWLKGTEPVARWNSESGITADEKYNMNNDFTLFIGNITIADEDTYICGSSYGGGVHVANRTAVHVYVDPDKLLIEECNDDGNDGDNDHDPQCKLVVDNGTVAVNLTCTVAHFYPEDGVDIAWTRAGERIEPTLTNRHNNSGGSGGSDPLTMCMHVLIAAAPSSEPYVCTVTGDALRGGERRLQAFVQLPPEMTSPTTTERAPEEGGGLESWVIAVIVAAGVLVIAAVAFLCFMKRRQNTRGTGKVPSAKYEKTADSDEAKFTES